MDDEVFRYAKEKSGSGSGASWSFRFNPILETHVEVGSRIVLKSGYAK
jgi:hypothetical protein